MTLLSIAGALAVGWWFLTRRRPEDAPAPVMWASDEQRTPARQAQAPVAEEWVPPEDALEAFSESLTKLQADRRQGPRSALADHADLPPAECLTAARVLGVPVIVTWAEGHVSADLAGPPASGALMLDPGTSGRDTPEAGQWVGVELRGGGTVLRGETEIVAAPHLGPWRLAMPALLRKVELRLTRRTGSTDGVTLRLARTEGPGWLRFRVCELSSQGLGVGLGRNTRLLRPGERRKAIVDLMGREYAALQVEVRYVDRDARLAGLQVVGVEDPDALARLCDVIQGSQAAA